MTIDWFPTSEEFRELPRWAVVAFAARCARRVLPLYSLPEGHPDAERRVAAVRGAVVFAELYAGADADSALAIDRAAGGVEAAASGSVDAALDALPTPPSVSAARAAKAARAAATTARFAARTPAPTLTAAHLASETARESFHAAEALDGNPALVQAARRDYVLLRDAARLRAWTDETPVPPEFFGPLWPDGAPKGWPIDDKLVLQFEIPEEVSDEQAAATLAEVVGLLDDIYRELGGQGLALHDLDAESLAPARTEVPR